MSDIQSGQMSSDMLDVSCDEDGQFTLTMKLTDGRVLHTNGKLVAGETDNAIPRSFKFDSEEFHKEVMKGNIDIRAVCAKLERLLNTAP